MRTPEEIKQGLEAIAETDVAARRRKIEAISGSYRYFEDIAADALEYIDCLEEYAGTVTEGEENCTNCAYGALIESNYCHDCRWFDRRNKRLKWASLPEEE